MGHKASRQRSCGMGLFHSIGRISLMSRINLPSLRQIESMVGSGLFVAGLAGSRQADPALAVRGHVRKKRSRSSGQETSTRPMPKPKEKVDESIFSDNPFIDDFLEWMGSPDGQQSIEVNDILWEVLKNVRLDAKQRKIIWPDAKRLDLDQSVRRIKKRYPKLPRDKVEDYLLYWIDEDHTPEGYSEAQLEELDRLTERWVADHLRQARTSKKRKKTRYS